MDYSRTAIGAAYQRYAHLAFDDEPYILEDRVLEGLLGEDEKSRIRAQEARYRTAESAALRSAILLRSRYCEDRLRSGGFEQYVILGAGLDTSAYRRRGIEAIGVFEIDRKESQAYKRRRLAEAGIGIPENLSYIPVDFETDDLFTVLSGSGIDASKRTLVSWLGVTVYLSEEAIRATLSAIARAFGRVSLVLTFARKRQGAGIAERGAARVGETWKSRFEFEEIEAMTRDCGFATCFRPSREEIQESCYRGRVDLISCPLSIGIAVAAKGDEGPIAGRPA